MLKVTLNSYLSEAKEHFYKAQSHFVHALVIVLSEPTNWEPLYFPLISNFNFNLFQGNFTCYP